MNRREFTQLLSVALASAPVFADATERVSRGLVRAPAMRLVKPPRLKPGALIGLIAPSGVMNDDRVQRAVKNIEELGFRVKIGNNIRAEYGSYAGSAAVRIADLHAMFSDRDVTAIWCARGGSGAGAMLPGIDYGLIRRNPKILVGYSDITALHLAILRRAGLVTFHGPVATSRMSDYAQYHLLTMLMSPEPTQTMHMSIENAKRSEKEAQFRQRTIREGIAEGRLIGGNLSVLAALIGTPYAADLRGSLLFLEDVSEAPYRIDRMLTQLTQSQNIKHAAGVMLGVFQRALPTDSEPSLSLDQVVDHHFAQRTFPSVYGYSFGHISHQMPLPMGIRARLDTREATLTLLESAVSG